MMTPQYGKVRKNLEIILLKYNMRYPENTIILNFEQKPYIEGIDYALFITIGTQNVVWDEVNNVEIKNIFWYVVFLKGDKETKKGVKVTHLIDVNELLLSF
jgi:hypothetical protein